jgi:UDP:flavonoid glycosyltransferase YjiC (YdhE family)
MMSNILFIFPPEPGHLLPTLPIAQRLALQGYRVTYLTSPEFGEKFANLGFDVEFFSESYYIEPGPDAFYHVSHIGQDLWTRVMENKSASRSLFLKDRIQQIVDRLRPKVIVMDRLFYLEYGVDFSKISRLYHIVLIWTSLPSWNRRLPEEVSNLVLCPVEFEIPHFRRSSTSLQYVEPSIDVHRSETEFDWPIIDQSKPLVICSFGTQAARHGDFEQRLDMILEAAGKLDALQFIAASGSCRAVNTLALTQKVPPNVYVTDTIPQLALLSRAALFITHAGLGSVKEALYMGVPMLAIPFGYDQPFNSMRIRQLGLGDSLLNKQLSPSAVHDRVAWILDHDEYRRRAAAFRQIFRDSQHNPRAAQLIHAEAESYHPSAN